MGQTKIRQEQISGGLDGWIDANETWTYASADDPTYTFTISGDKTDKYSAGMRIKLTQTTVKYFIITKVAYSSPNTTITVYGGTDYDLADATITNPYYSMVKAPQGFPLSPTKWTESVEDSYSNTNASVTTYNVASLDVPTGEWIINYSGYARTNYYGSGWRARPYAKVKIGTTSTGSEVRDFRFNWHFEDQTTSGYHAGGYAPFAYTELASLSSDGSRHISVEVLDTGASNFRIYGYDFTIKATCAYL